MAVSPCWSAVAVPALQPAVCLGRLAAASSRQLPPSFVAVSPCWSAVAVPALQPAVCLHIASVALPRPHCRQTPPQGHRNGSTPAAPLVGVQECPGPASAPERFFKPLHFRSGPTDCLVEALRVPFAGLPSAQPSAAALHSTVLFKRLNPPQWRYTLSC